MSQSDIQNVTTLVSCFDNGDLTQFCEKLYLRLLHCQSSDYEKTKKKNDKKTGKGNDAPDVLLGKKSSQVDSRSKNKRMM